MIRKTGQLLLLCGIFATLQQAKADFVVTIGNGNGIASTTYSGYQGQSGVSVPVFGYFVSPGSNGLGAFNLSLDFGANQGGAGFGLPTGFSAGSFSIAGGGTPLNGAQSLDTVFAPFLNGIYPGSVNFDFIASGSHTPDFNLSTNPASPTKLFDLVFDVGGTATPGIYAIDLILDTTIVDIVNGNTENSTTIAPGSLGSLSRFNGSFEVLAAVPEPSSLLGLFGLGLLSILHRKNRKSQIRSRRS